MNHAHTEDWFVTLMTPEVFRWDELWLMEKVRSGASQLFALGEFTP